MTQWHANGAPKVGARSDSWWSSMRRATGARPLRTAKGSQLFVLMVLLMVPGAVMIGPLLLELLERKIGGTR